MNALVIVDAADVEASRTVHGLELALELTRSEGVTVRVFLLGAAVELACCGGASPRPADSGPAVSRLVSAGAEVAVSKTELLARRLSPEDLMVGAQPASGPTLAAWTLLADRLLTF